MNISGKSIRNARHVAGVSQEKFAAQIGVGEKYLAHIEAGRKPVPLKLIKKIEEEIASLPIRRRPPVLARVFEVHGISVADCAGALRVRESAITAALRQNSAGQTLRGKIETWLTSGGISVRGVWNLQEEPPMEAVDLSHEAMTRFKLFKDPLSSKLDPRVFFGANGEWPEILGVEKRLEQAFVAQKSVVVRGQVGSGKSTLVRRVLAKLETSNERLFIIEPETVDKGLVRPSLILEAIIVACNTEGTKSRLGNSLEDRSRLAKKALVTVVERGFKPVLLFEEAHLLPDDTIKHFKSMSEWFHGVDSLLGIVMVGQPELDAKIKRWVNRQWFSRCPKIEMPGLGDRIPEYLRFRFEAVSADPDRVFSADGLAAIRERMKTQIFDTPLLVANFCKAAINAAAAIGSKVTERIVQTVRPMLAPDLGEVRDLRKRGAK